MMDKSEFAGLKKDVLYYLLDKGKLEWRNIEEFSRKRKWSSATLKKTLEELIAEGLVYEDIKHSSTGTTVWYGATINKIAKNLYGVQKEIAEKDVAFYLPEELKTTSSSFRRSVLDTMVCLFLYQFIDYFFLTALIKQRNSRVKSIDSIILGSSTYFYDVLLRKNFEKILKYVLEFPEETQLAIAEIIEAIDRLGLKEYVKDRELEDLIKARGTLLETKHQLKQILPKLLDNLRKRVEEPRTIEEKFKIKKTIRLLKRFLYELENEEGSNFK